MSSSARRTFAASLWLTAFLVSGSQVLAGDGAFDKVIRAMKGVAWAAVSTGLDEAANRLLGPTAWRIVKKIGEPALKELLPAGDKPSREVAARVVESLDSDAVLRQEVRLRFDSLPRDERNALLGKLEQIEDRLSNIERLAVDTNLTVKELKEFLLSVVSTPTLAPPPRLPKGLRPFDAGDSLLSIVYPQDLEPPRKIEDVWYVGARFEQGWKLWPDYSQPAMAIRLEGIPRRDKASGERKRTSAEKEPSLDALRQILMDQKCAKADERILVQELSKDGPLFVGMCDRTWPTPNTYVAYRYFYSNGAMISIRAVIIGDSTWRKYEDPLLSSMRLTRLRGVCGFYGTSCCLPAGTRACGPGLSCQNEICLPLSSGK